MKALLAQIGDCTESTVAGYGDSDMSELVRGCES